MKEGNPIGAERFRLTCWWRKLSNVSEPFCKEMNINAKTMQWKLEPHFQRC